jgi:hypothetical protein
MSSPHFISIDNYLYFAPKDHFDLEYSHDWVLG